MSTMEYLNDQYVKAVKSFDTLRKYEVLIKAETDNGALSETTRAVNSAALLTNLSREIDCTDFGLLKDTALTVNQYLDCFNAINQYKMILSQSGADDASAVFSALNQIRQAQGRYDEMKTAFHQKYSFNVESIKALNLIILISVRKALAKAQNRVEHLKDEAWEAVAEYTTELRKTDPIMTGNTLPTELLVARIPVQSVSMQIMRDIGTLVSGTLKRNISFWISETEGFRNTA